MSALWGVLQTHRGGLPPRGWDLLALQRERHHSLEHRPTQFSAIATVLRVLQCDRHYDGGLVGRGEPDERSGVPPVTAALLVDSLGGPGLACHPVGRYLRHRRGSLV